MFTLAHQTPDSSRVGRVANPDHRFLTVGFALLPVVFVVSFSGPRSLAGAIIHLLLATAALCASAFISRSRDDQEHDRTGPRSRFEPSDCISLAVLALAPFPFVSDTTQVALAIGVLTAASLLAHRSGPTLRGLSLVKALAPFALALPYQLLFTR